MTFLAPLVGLVAAAAGGAGVLTFYFLKLRRRPLRISSTLLWQQAATDLEVNTPFRWLRSNWLLLLQLLIVLLLAAALARPALPSGGLAVSRLIVLVDRSASMSVADAGNGQTRLEAALDRAGELIERAADADGTRIVIASYASETRVHAGWSDAKGPLRRGLGEIGPTDQPGDLSDAIETIEAILLADNTDETVDAARIVVLTDNASPAVESATAVVSLESFGGVGTPNNTGVVAAGARRDFEDPSVVRVFARVLSTRGEPRLQSVRISVGSRVIDRRAIETGADGSSVAVSFEYTEPSEHVVNLSIDGADALAADNTASVVVPRIGSAAVLLVRDRIDGDPKSWIAADVLRALDPEQLRVVPTASYRADPAASVSGAGLVVFDRATGTLPLPREVPTLALGCVVEKTGVVATRTGPGTRVLTWDRDHPVLVDARLDRLVIDKTIGLGTVEAAEGTVAVVTELARGNTGPLIVESETASVRHLTVGFDPSVSSWPLDVGFALFLATAVERLTFASATGDGVAFEIGKPVNLRSDQARFVSDRGDRLSGNAVGGRVDLGLAERVGIYRPEATGDTEASPIAVNLLSEQETRIRAVAPQESGDTRSAGAAAIDTGPREIRGYFVMAAFVLAAVEWLVYLARNRSIVGGRVNQRLGGVR
ncbi:MAG: VWA domain-containing protein [Planctomycetota bacterium]